MTTPPTPEQQYTVSQGVEVAREFTGILGGPTTMRVEILKLRATVARLEAELKSIRELDPHGTGLLPAALRRITAEQQRAEAAERRVEATASALGALEDAIARGTGVALAFTKVRASLAAAPRTGETAPVVDDVCQECSGQGWVEGVELVAVCCGRPSTNGECCGVPEPQQTQEPCPACTPTTPEPEGARHHDD